MRVWLIFLFFFFPTNPYSQSNLTAILGEWSLYQYTDETGQIWGFFSDGKGWKPGDNWDHSKMTFKKKKVTLKRGVYEKKTAYDLKEDKLTIEGNTMTFNYLIINISEKELILKYQNNESDQKTFFLHYKRIK